MAKLKPVATTDPARILLTEVLPYELPVYFSDLKLHALLSSGVLPPETPPGVRKLLSLASRGKRGRRPTVPYEYRIQRSNGKLRTLSIMHPANQLEFIRFYKDYDSYILNVCARSEFSLRRPVHVASAFAERDFLDPDAEEPAAVGDPAPSLDSVQRSYASSYFYYARYSQVWKFYDSTEFRRLEQDFRHLLLLDIAECFPSLYTHSLSWALRGKEFSKLHKNAYSFDGELDSLMQSANWGETNGVLIGPGISRLFAEIVLQDIDIRFEEVLRTRDFLKLAWPSDDMSTTCSCLESRTKTLTRPSDFFLRLFADTA